jgi:hypothetical protein
VTFGPDELDSFRRYIESTAGGYLRNIIREPRVTCSVCATPVDGFDRCYQCNRARGVVGIAQRVGSLTYAVAGTQSAHLMRGYKGHPPSEQHQAMVAILVATAVDGHTRCLERLSGQPVTHWATVPSLPARSGEHRLHALIQGFMSVPEVPLTAAVRVADPRAVKADHFTVVAELPESSHVLLIDDTWTSGGHAQSAAAALTAAGAGSVSVLVVARWIEPTFGNNKEFVSRRLTADYNASICPWTAGACP